MAYAPESLKWLGREWEKVISSAQLSGIVGDSSHTYGYHVSRNQLSGYDYSKDDCPEDREGDGNAASAIDISMNESDMILVTNRFYNSWKDPNDPRLNYCREFIGTRNGTTVIRGDTYFNELGTSDSTHLWHEHISFLRKWATSMDAAKAVLSVVKGESLEKWLGQSDNSNSEDEMYSTLIPLPNEYEDESTGPIQPINTGGFPWGPGFFYIGLDIFGMSIGVRVAALDFAGNPLKIWGDPAPIVIRTKQPFHVELPTGTRFVSIIRKDSGATDVRNWKNSDGTRRNVYMWAQVESKRR